MALSGLGQPDVAIRDLEFVLESEPGHLDAVRQLARLLGDTGRFDDARSRLQAVPTDRLSASERSRIHFELARLSQIQGAWPEAIEDYRRATQLDPDFADAHFSLAVCLSSDGQYAEAAEKFAEVVERRPAHEQALFGLATAHMWAGQHRKAVEVLDEGIRKFPASRGFPLILARLRATSADETVRNGRQALELAQSGFEATGRSEFAECIALALAELGDFEQAVEWQRRVIESGVKAGASPETLALARIRLDELSKRRPIRTATGAGP
jgi:tetratricopeptide (TPR) repeat protein